MRDRRNIVFWLVALIVFTALLAVLRDVLLPFATGAVLAYFLNPVADRLERMGLSRTAAAAVIVGLAGIALLVTVLLLAPIAIGQLTQLAKSLPSDLERARASLEKWAAVRLGDSFPGLRAGIERAFGELTKGSSGLVSDAVQFIVRRGTAVFSLVSLLLVTPVVVFYFLCDWHAMLARIDSWLPRDHRETIRRIAFDIDQAVSAFVRGQGTICLLFGLLYAIGLSLIRLRYGLVIGVTTGLLLFVPIVGWSLGLGIAILVALSQAWPDPTLALWVIAIYAGGMALDAGVLSPQIVGHRIGLHPVWLIFALFVFSALFGLVGTLVAVPVAAAVGVLVRFALARYLESPVYLGSGGIAADREHDTRGPGS